LIAQKNAVLDAEPIVRGPQGRFPACQTDSDFMGRDGHTVDVEILFSLTDGDQFMGGEFIWP
jgi:hypothetical protein